MPEDPLLNRRPGNWESMNDSQRRLWTIRAAMDYHNAQPEFNPPPRVARFSNDETQRLIPLAPPNVNIDDNIQEAKEAADNGKNFVWFRDKVKKFGPWDYKEGERKPQYADFGNFNYGAVGTAFGYSPDTLLREAGRANKGDGAWDPKNGEPVSPWEAYFGYGGKPPYGDDLRGQEMIKQGIDYHNRVAGK